MLEQPNYHLVDPISSWVHEPHDSRQARFEVRASSNSYSSKSASWATDRSIVFAERLRNFSHCRHLQQHHCSNSYCCWFCLSHCHFGTKTQDFASTLTFYALPTTFSKSPLFFIALFYTQLISLGFFLFFMVVIVSIWEKVVVVFQFIVACIIIFILVFFILFYFLIIIIIINNIFYNFSFFVFIIDLFLVCCLLLPCCYHIIVAVFCFVLLDFGVVFSYCCMFYVVCALEIIYILS